MRRSTFLRMSALATLTCFGMMNVSAGRQVIRSERFGDGYTFGVDQCVSTTESLIGKEGHTLFTSTVSHTAGGDQFTDRTLISYAADGLSSTSLSQTLKQKNLGSEGGVEVLEFVFDNKSRSFTFYNEDGKTIRTYSQNWQTRSTGSDWSKTNSEGWEYDYDAEGRMAGARYWRTYAEGADPTYTFTLSYDNDGNLVRMMRDGIYTTSPLMADLTWDNGRLIRMDYKKSTGRDDNGNPVWADDCNYIFTYDGNLLTDYAKYVYKSDGSTEGSVKNCFEYGGNGSFVKYSTGLGMSGISYGVADTDYDSVTTYSVNKKSVEPDGEVNWTLPSQKYVNYWVDLNSAESLTAGSLEAKAGLGVGDVIVSCFIPGHNKEITATLYRDCEAVASKTLAEYGEAFDDVSRTLTITDKTSGGLHSYTVALSQPGVDGVAYGPVPEPVEINVEANLPAISNFRVLGAYKQEKTASGMDEDGKFVTQTIVNNIVTIGWDPVSKEDAETYGFNKYEFWNSFYGIGVAYTSQRTCAQYDISLDENEEGDVWMEIDYGMGRVKSEKIHVRMADYLSQNDAEVWGLAKIYNPDFYDSNFSMVKGNLNDPESDPEVLADLYVTDDLAICDVYGGTNVGEYYYAHMSDDYGRNRLYSINFTSNELVPVASFSYGDPGYEARNLTYDPASDRIYAVADIYDEEADEIMHRLMSIDYNTGAVEVVADMTALPYVMAAADGVIYAGVQEGSYTSYKLALYTLDPATGALTPVDNVEPFAMTMNEARAMAFNEGKLHITIGTSYTVVDLASGNVSTMPSLKKGYYAFTFQPSTLTAEPAGDPEGSDADPRKLYRKASYGDSMGAYTDSETRETLYYYNLDGNIAREVARSRKATDSGLTDEWFTDGLTRYEYTADGKLSEVNDYQYGLYDLDMESRQLRSTKSYVYNEAGQLATETETLPSTIIGMPDRVTETSYTYDEAGRIAGKTESSGGYVNSTVSYTYDDFDRILLATSEAYGMTTLQRYSYDIFGHLIEIVSSSPESGEITGLKRWEYFDGTDILSSEAEYYAFDADGEPTGGFRTVYEPVEYDMNLIHSYEESLFDGQWTAQTGSHKMGYYADFKGMAEQVATELDVHPADGINAALLSFTIPNAVMVDVTGSGFNIVRNGETVATFTGEELFSLLDYDSMTFRWTDSLVPNGDNEYFVQPLISQTGGIEPWDLEIRVPEYIGYNISNIAGISFDTEIPAVSGIRVEGYEKAYVNEYDQPVTNPLYGREVYMVTIAWDNPSECKDLGFIANNVYQNPYLLKVASVDDPEVTQASFCIELDGKADVYVRSVYSIGHADSEVYAIDLNQTGIDGTIAAGSRICDGILMLDAPADVDVFDLEGRRIAGVAGSDTVDLRGHDGIVVIVVSRADKTETIKTTLR